MQVVHPLVGQAGFSIEMFQIDYMHCDLLGVRAHVCGSVLLELCNELVFGVSPHAYWKLRLQDQLDRATLEFKNWVKITKRTCQFYGVNIGKMHPRFLA